LQTLYTGKENVTPIDELTQAQYYSDIVRFVSCDSSVRSLSFFHLIDETNLDRWQSGLMRVDFSKRPSFTSVKTAIAQTQGKCALAPAGWKHTTGVNGAKVAFGYLGNKRLTTRLWRFRVSLQEDATYKVGLVRVAPGRLSAKSKKSIANMLARTRSKPLLGRTGRARAYKSTLVSLQKKRVKQAGWYVYGIRVAAAMNPKRTYVAVSKPFLIREAK
jgi:hypothetical protein